MDTILSVLGFIWALPCTLVGFLLALPYGARSPIWHKGAIVFKVSRLIGFSNTAGQTLGAVVFTKLDKTDSGYDYIIRHELVHVKQFKIGGVLFAIAYGIACIVAAAKGGNFYVDNYFEVQARTEASKNG